MAAPIAASIAIAGLQHHYGRGALRRQVLHDIQLRVEEGEIVLLTGPSGSGKTTLLNLIGGLRQGQGGSLRVLGRELIGAGDRQLTQARREHGYIFQAHNLHRSLTALQNVRMALEVSGTLSAAVMQQRAAQRRPRAAPRRRLAVQRRGPLRRRSSSGRRRPSRRLCAPLRRDRRRCAIGPPSRRGARPAALRRRR